MLQLRVEAQEEKLEENERYSFESVTTTPLRSRLDLIGASEHSIVGAKVLSPTYIVQWVIPTKLSWGFHLIKRSNAIEQVHFHFILSYVCDMFHNLLC